MGGFSVKVKIKEAKMKKSHTQKMESVPAHYYNKEYFFDKKLYGGNSGHDSDVFLKSGEDRYLHKRFSILKEIDIKPGSNVLDLGCGRGEAMVYLLKKGARAFGLDYSADALEISRKAVRNLFGIERCFFAQANAQNLPFRDKRFDMVFLSEVIEHLHPSELNNCLREIRRVLKDDGLLVLHTSPNRWYFDYGYVFYRLFRRLNDGTALKKNPRTKYDLKMHVNEQTYSSLRRILKDNRFKGKIWLENNIETKSSNPLKKTLSFMIYNSPLKLFFANDLYGIMRKVS